MLTFKIESSFGPTFADPEFIGGKSMKHFAIIFCFLSCIEAAAKVSCALPIFSMSPSGPTPLQIEAEDVLSLRGYKLQRRTASEFAQANLADFEMFATARTGTMSPATADDCVMREFEDLGKFYTCHFELRIYVYSPETFEFIESVRIDAATRDARSTDNFYASVRRQFSVLPSCVEF